MRLINADMIVYYEHTNADGKFVGELAWKDQIDNLPTYDGEMCIANLIERNKNSRKEIKALRVELQTLRKAYELMARDFALKNHCSSIKECSDCLVNDECHSAEWLMEYYKCLVLTEV